MIRVTLDKSNRLCVMYDLATDLATFVISKNKLKKYINTGDEKETIAGWDWKAEIHLVQLMKQMFEQYGIHSEHQLKTREGRQSAVARLFNLIRQAQQHADEVVEAEQLEDETVHGANDVTQDIPDAPKREEAEGQESTSENESNSENSDGNQDGQDGKTQSSEENGQKNCGSDQGTAENEESSRGIGGIGKDDQENTSQSTIDIEAEIAACFGVGVGEEVEERHNTIAGKALSVVKELRELFEKLAYERAPYGRTDELEHWDGRKLVLAKANPNKLMRAKSGKEKDASIYFFLDDSGSMRSHAQMFQGLLEASRHVVHVYRGSEAHPVEAVDGSYESEYIWSFCEQLKKWLDTVRPTPGSVLIFWGDTCDMNIRGDEQKVRKLLRPYRAYWLGMYKKYDYEGWEQECLPAAGFKVLAPVSSPKELRQAVRKIK